VLVKFARLFHSPAGRLEDCGGQDFAPDARIFRTWTEARPWSLVGKTDHRGAPRQHRAAQGGPRQDAPGRDRQKSLRIFLPLAAKSRYPCAWKMAYFSTEPAPERRNVTGKNRVWDFFRFPNETHPASRRQPVQPRRKIRPTATKPASGIPYWPSRDPIEEKGFSVLKRQTRDLVVTKRSVSGRQLYDYNLYTLVQNSPVDGVDYLGLAAICDKLWQCATLWNNRHWSTLQDANRIQQQSIIDNAWRDCYKRIAPSNVRQGVEGALKDLGVSGVSVTQGTDLKATVPATIFDTLATAGLTVEKVDTISDESAWRVPLASGWELKIYKSPDNSYRAAVGYVTESAAHYRDAVWYIARRLHLAEGYPNSYNAEEYGGFWGVDQQSLEAVRRYSPCCPGIF